MLDDPEITLLYPNVFLQDDNFLSFSCILTNKRK